MSELRLGIVGLDTSHVVAFTELLNLPEKTHHIPGGRVVAAYPGGSMEFALSRDRVGNYTTQLNEKFGVQMVDSIEALADQVDAVLLESVDSRQHLEQFTRLAPFGKPVFIDKPLATSVADACAIVELSSKHNSPVFSCSSLRYAAGIAELAAGEEVLACTAYGPAPILPDFPGLFWYGVHSAEFLFAKMGTGCRQVRVVAEETADIVVGTWSDGRVGTLYGHRLSNQHQFGATVITNKGIAHSTALSSPPYYAMLLQQVMEFFNTRVSPLPMAETLEITAFLEAANQSRATGETVALRDVTACK